MGEGAIGITSEEDLEGRGDELERRIDGGGVGVDRGLQVSTSVEVIGLALQPRAVLLADILCRGLSA